jgi:hypothetical protein
MEAAEAQLCGGTPADHCFAWPPERVTSSLCSPDSCRRHLPPRRSPATDSLVTCSAALELESYRYGALASAGGGRDARGEQGLRAL